METYQWESKLRKYKSYKNYIRFLNASSGVWPDYGPRAIRIFLRFFSAFGSAFAFYGIVMFDIKSAASIDTFTRGLGLLIAYSSTFMKLCVMVKFQDSLRYLNNNIRASFERDMKNPELHTHALRHFSVFYNFCRFYTVFIGSTIILMIATPLYFAFKKGKYIRMYPQYLPFVIKPGGMLHWMIFGQELYACFYLWTVSSGTDFIFGFYSLHVVGEIRVLSHLFRNLKSSKDYKKDLKECVRRHLMIMDTMPVLERIFGFLSLWLAITCAIAICSLIFQFSNMKNVTPIRTCYLITHVFAKLMQSFTYAWYGNIIQTESEKCLDAVYESRWPETLNKKFMTDIIIILSQKPLIFNAVHFMYLGLDMFSKILNTSISYYFLLKTLEEKA